MTDQQKETFKIKGDQLLKKVKELIAEGNVRRITVEDREGKPIVVIPLTVGVIGAVLAAPLAALGAVAALVSECSITVERVYEPPVKNVTKQEKSEKEEKK